MRVLVTGAFGYIGMAVARRLAAAGHTVLALTSRPPGAAGAGAGAGAGAPEFIAAVHRVDLRDAGLRDAGLRDAGLRDAVAGVDGVCHLAGLAGVRDSAGRGDAYTAVNVGGTSALLRALLLEGRSTAGGGPVRFVLASSAVVYGAPERQPITEATPLDPASPYGASKVAAERAVAAAVRGAAGAGLGAVSLRIFNAAGADGGRADPSTTRVIPNVLAVAAGRAPAVSVNGDGSVVRDYVHVTDVADAFVRALGACAPGTHPAYNIGATPASVAQILAAARKVTGRPIPVTWQPARDEPPVLVADCALGRRELGWAPARSALPQIIADAWAAISSAGVG